MASVNTEDFLYGVAPARGILQEVTNKKFTEYGLDFPIGSGPFKSGYFRKISGKELIIKNIKQLLLTEKGERVMLPNYGVSLRKYLFEPIDELLFNEIRKDITTTIYSYLKDVTIRKLAILKDDESSSSGGYGLHILLILGLTQSKELFEVKVTIS